MEVPNEQDLPQPPYEPSSETICMVRTFSQNQNFNYRTPQIGLHRHILYRLNPIKKYSAYQGKTWKCDVCGKVAKPKDESWNCPKCNFDACDECVRNRHSILFPQAICDKLKEKSYVDFDEKTYDGFAFTFGGKEKVIYDSSRDEKLRMILLSLDSGNLYQQYKTLETQKDQYLFLSKFVYDLLGKNNTVKQCDEDLAKILKLNNSRALYIGQMTYGVCRHKAALFKFLCDRMQLPCRILVGTCNVGDKVDFHSWNVVKIGDVQYLLDVYNAPKKMFDISDEEIVKRYKRISWMQLREAMNKSKSGDKPKGEPDYVIGGPGGYSIGPK